MSALDRYLSLSQRRPRTLLASAVVLTLASAWLSSRLALRSDFVELLPKSDRNVEVFGELVRRVGTASSLLIGVESDDFAANKRFVDDLGARLAAYPPDVIKRVSFNIRDEKAFFERNKYLYASYDDLVSIRDELRARYAGQLHERVFDIGLEDETERVEDEPLDFEAMKAKYRSRASEYDRFVDGYFTEAGGKMLAIVVRPAGSSLQVAKARALMSSIERDIAALHPERYAPGMRFTFTGDVRTAVDEHDALRDDLIAVSVLVLILEILAILLYYRTLRSLVILGLPLAAGVTVTFAITYLSIGYLSSSTAFLGSIVIGNGINSGIMLFARYMEDRRAGLDVSAALRSAVVNTMAGTLSASLGAAIAYGAMMLTRFRGFSQFGLIGLVGMVACWLFTYLVMPPLLVFLESRRRLVRGDRDEKHRAVILGPIASWVSRHPLGIVVGGAALSVVAAIAFVSYLVHDPFEYDFNKLRTKRLVTSVEDNLRRDRVKNIFGETQAPNVILAQREDQVPRIARVLESDEKVRRFVDRYETLESYLPSRQQEKLQVLAEIRSELQRIRPRVDAAVREKIDSYMPSPDLRPLTADDLPKVVSDRFVETDGRRGLIVYVYPKKDFRSYDGHVLLEYAAATGELHLDNGEIIPTAGRPTIFAAMISSIMHDGPRATLVALLGVMLLAALSFRRAMPTLMVALTVLAGVALTGGLMAALGVKLNFLNFIVLPITFGIGADYSFNLVRRYLADGPGSVADAVRNSGGAVALCSLTTIIGYGTLLVSENRALNSFGALAGAGEVACLSIALVLMPAVLFLLESRAASFGTAQVNSRLGESSGTK